MAIIARSIVSALFEQKDFYGYRAPAPRTVGFLNLDSATASLLRAQFPSALEANRVKILSEASATQAPSDFASPDGRALLLASMRDEVDVAVVCHRAAPAKALHSSLDLPRLHEAVFRKARAVVHLVQLAKNQPFESWLQCCSSALIVCPCSPDVGYSYAHMVRPADGTLLAAIGVEPVIENVRPRLDRTVESFVGPCVSADAVSREIARQAEEGRSLAQIGDSLGFDKSTIKRRLDRLGFKIKRGPQLRDE